MQDQELKAIEQVREELPANVEGSVEFNEVSAENEQDQEMTIEEVLADPKLKEAALINAQFIEKQMGTGWFSLSQLIAKKIFPKEEPATDMMNLLCLMNLAYRKTKPNGNVVRYKITFDVESRLIILNEHLADLNRQAAVVQTQIDKLLAKSEKP